MPFLERLNQRFSVAPDVGLVTGNVGNREQRREFLQNLLLVRRAVLVGGAFGRGLGGQGDSNNRVKNETAADSCRIIFRTICHTSELGAIAVQVSRTNIEEPRAGLSFDEKH